MVCSHPILSWETLPLIPGIWFPHSDLYEAPGASPLLSNKGDVELVSLELLPRVCHHLIEGPLQQVVSTDDEPENERHSEWKQWHRALSTAVNREHSLLQLHSLATRMTGKAKTEVPSAWYWVWHIQNAATQRTHACSSLNTPNCIWNYSSVKWYHMS